MHVCMVWFSWHKIPIWSHKNLWLLNFNYVLLIRELAEGLETLLSWPWDIPQLIELPFLGGKYCHRILKQDLSLCYIKAFIPRGSSLNFTLFFLSGFPFTTIHESQDCRGRPRATTLYHFHLLYRHLLISQAITAESSPLHTGRSRIRTRNLWFPSANC